MDAVYSDIRYLEQHGYVEKDPFTYFKVITYYDYSKLFLNEGLISGAEKFLKLADCTANPIDCKPYLYAEYSLTYRNFYFYRKTIPVIFGKYVALYNLYAYYWINEYWNTDKPEEFKKASTIKSQLKRDFLFYSHSFFKNAEKPIVFIISHKLTPADYFLAKTLMVALRRGWAKRIVFYGDYGDYLDLIHKGYLFTAVKFQPYQDNNYDYIWVY